MQELKKAKVKQLRTRGRCFEVLLRQGLKIKTLGDRGSLLCCYGKASMLSPPSLGQWKSQLAEETTIN
jgi:hypothetical protein